MITDSEVTEGKLCRISPTCSATGGSDDIPVPVLLVFLVVLNAATALARSAAALSGGGRGHGREKNRRGSPRQDVIIGTFSYYALMRKRVFSLDCGNLK